MPQIITDDSKVSRLLTQISHHLNQVGKQQFEVRQFHLEEL
jgi:hypothetical protein